jgi:hypothetical protein
MTTLAKPKTSEMKPEVRAMIDARHQAEQRGHYEPLGRLLALMTEHGTIQFPIQDGEGLGPDVAAFLPSVDSSAPGVAPVADLNTLIVLGAWTGLPPIRCDSTTPCPKCKTKCDSCDGSGTKQCEGVGCGGSGTVPGKWILCPAENCSGKTGKINPAGCDTCHGAGQIAEQLECPMCKGSKRMQCPRCHGSGKISTGYRGGAMPGFDQSKGRTVVPPVCTTCKGTAFYEGFAEQDVETFTNAFLKYDRAVYAVLGPIRSFCISDHRMRHTRIFDVGPDSAGDLAVLLVPNSGPVLAKSYLVGGVVRERMTSAGTRK